MSCACENKKAMEELKRVRELAKKTAELTDEVQILFIKEDGTYNFVPYGEEYKGKYIEYII